MAEQPNNSGGTPDAGAGAPATGGDSGGDSSPTIQDFSGFGMDSVEDSVSLDVPESEEPVGGEQTVTEPPQEQVPPIVQTQPPVQPPVTEPPKEQTGAVQSSPPSESQSLVEQLASNRDAIIGELGKTRFALSKVEEDALEADAIGAMPQIMGRVYYEAVTATINHIQNLVPRMIGQYMQAQNVQRGAEEQFFGQFPMLNKQTHMADVLQFANLVRAQNPRVTQEELFALVGNAVVAKNGLTRAPQPGNGRVASPQPAPFVPAKSGGSVRITPEPESPYFGLGQNFD